MRLGDINGITIVVDDSAPYTAATSGESAVAAKYTTYILGAGAIQYAQAPVKTPSEVVREALTGGGYSALVTRLRETIHPNGFSFTKPTSGYTASPTDAQLGASANWSIIADPKTIALERLQPKSGYPACMLCKENIGYAGRINFPARQTHRIVPITLAGEQFYLQYSPYAYFHEHCIMLHEQHKPMEMNKQTLAEIFDFVGQFPHYTCGSNADLPIVGGSILSHSHFQGGRYVFPMQKADIAVPMTDIRYPGVKAGILNWPVSAVRLVGRSSQQMQNVANNILSAWRSYTDESVGILAETDGTPHNTVTPILHYDETEGYILDLALRNNRTSEEYPDGIFHPHREYHNIKKENIGLIEVMGLAILPARLKDQGAQIAEILAGQRPNTSREAGDTLAVHADWIDELIAKYGTHMKPQDANKAVKAEIGTVFSHVLENAGVFKQDAAGQAAFVRFMQSVGFKKA